MTLPLALLIKFVLLLIIFPISSLLICWSPIGSFYQNFGRQNFFSLAMATKMVAAGSAEISLIWTLRCKKDCLLCMFFLCMLFMHFCAEKLFFCAKVLFLSFRLPFPSTSFHQFFTYFKIMVCIWYAHKWNTKLLYLDWNPDQSSMVFMWVLCQIGIWGRKKNREPGKKTLEQAREPIQLTWHQTGIEPVGRRWVLSLLCHPCSPLKEMQ